MDVRLDDLLAGIPALLRERRLGQALAPVAAQRRWPLWKNYFD
jgi:hypothetical protein